MPPKGREIQDNLLPNSRCIPETGGGDTEDPSDENPELAGDTPQVAIMSLAAYRSGPDLCLGCASSCASQSIPNELNSSLGIGCGEPHRVMWNYVNRMNGVLRTPEEYSIYQQIGEDGPELVVAGPATVMRSVPWPQLSKDDCSQMEESMPAMPTGFYNVLFNYLPAGTEGHTETVYQIHSASGC